MTGRGSTTATRTISGHVSRPPGHRTQRGDSCGWLTGGDRMVIRGGYSMLYDRIGFALATIFDQSISFGMSTRLPATFGSSDETVPGARFVNLSTLPATMPAAAAGGIPGDAAARGRGDLHAASMTRSPRRTTTSSTRWSDGNCGTTSPIEAAYVGRRGHNLLIRRDLAMPLNLTDTEVRHGLLHRRERRRYTAYTRARGRDAALRREFTRHCADRRTGKTCSRAPPERCRAWHSPRRSDGASLLPERP